MDRVWKWGGHGGVRRRGCTSPKGDLGGAPTASTTFPSRWSWAHLSDLCDKYISWSLWLHVYISVQFSTSIVSNSLRPHGMQHASLPCPSPNPGVYSNSCPLSWWCHPTICCPLLLPPSIFPRIRVFYNESVICIRWPKYWSFSFSISPSNEYSGLISFRMDWWDLLAIQGTLKSLLQHHSSKVLILWSSAFFMVQLSHPYMTTGKTIALMYW